VQDDIELRELLSALWQRKWLVVFPTILGFVAAIVIIQVSTPTYRATGHLGLASFANLAAANRTNVMATGYLGPATFVGHGAANKTDALVIEIDATGISPLQAFRRSLIKLESSAVRQKAYESAFNSTPNLDNISTGEFQQNINIIIPRPKRGSAASDMDQATVTFEHPDKNIARQVIEALAFETNLAATTSLVEEIEYKLKLQIQSVEGKLAQAKELQGAENSSYLEQVIIDLRLESNTLKQYLETDYSALTMIRLTLPVNISDKPVKPLVRNILGFGVLAGAMAGLLSAILLFLIQRNRA